MIEETDLSEIDKKLKELELKLVEAKKRHRTRKPIVSEIAALKATKARLLSVAFANGSGCESCQK